LYLKFAPVQTHRRDSSAGVPPALASSKKTPARCRRHVRNWPHRLCYH